MAASLRNVSPLFPPAPTIQSMWTRTSAFIVYSFCRDGVPTTSRPSSLVLQRRGSPHCTPPPHSAQRLFHFYIYRRCFKTMKTIFFLHNFFSFQQITLILMFILSKIILCVSFFFQRSKLNAGKYNIWCWCYVTSSLNRWDELSKSVRWTEMILAATSWGVGVGGERSEHSHRSTERCWWPTLEPFVNPAWIVVVRAAGVTIREDFAGREGGIPRNNSSI